MVRIPRPPPLILFPRVLEHTDWRVFLRAWLRAHRRAFKRKGVSAFARDAGCSPSQVGNVLARRRELHDPLIESFGRAACLQGPLLAYWKLMVSLSEASSIVRPQILAEMAEIRAAVGNYPSPTTETILAVRALIRPVEGTSIERYLARWIHPVVLALAGCPDFPTRLHEVVAGLHRRVTTTAVRQALAELVALGLLAELPDGSFRPTGEVLANYVSMPPATYQLHYAQDLEVAIRQLYDGATDDSFILERDEVPGGTLSEQVEAMVGVISEAGVLAEEMAGPGRCTVAQPAPSEGAPRPDRALEVAVALVPATREAPMAEPPPPSPLVRRKRGRPPKGRPG